MGNNGYLQRVEEEKQASLYAGEKTAWQQAMDFVAMALNDPDCVGAKNVMSGEKISDILNYACALRDEYHLAFTPSHPEADVWQERLDKRQRKIFKEKAQPFYERYRYIKKMKYGKRR